MTRPNTSSSVLAAHQAIAPSESHLQSEPICRLLAPLPVHRSGQPPQCNQPEHLPETSDCHEDALSNPWQWISDDEQGCVATDTDSYQKYGPGSEITFGQCSAGQRCSKDAYGREGRGAVVDVAGSGHVGNYPRLGPSSVGREARHKGEADRRACKCRPLQGLKPTEKPPRTSWEGGRGSSKNSPRERPSDKGDCHQAPRARVGVLGYLLPDGVEACAGYEPLGYDDRRENSKTSARNPYPTSSVQLGQASVASSSVALPFLS